MVCVLLEGFAYTYRDNKKGERQINDLLLAGDFHGVTSMLAGTPVADCVAAADCRIAVIARPAFSELLQSPTLLQAFWRVTSADSLQLTAIALHMSSTDALHRAAYLLCLLQTRMKQRGLAEGNSCVLPLSQGQLAEAIGLTPVHMNRVLRVLRERGLVTFRHQLLHIHDWHTLCQLANYKPSTLSQ